VIADKERPNKFACAGFSIDSKASSYNPGFPTYESMGPVDAVGNDELVSSSMRMRIRVCAVS